MSAAVPAATPVLAAAEVSAVMAAVLLVAGLALPSPAPSSVQVQMPAPRPGCRSAPAA